MTSAEYRDLLEVADRAASKLGRSFTGVLPIDRDGKPLDAITPGCILYIACGETGLVGVNDALMPIDLEVTP